MLNNMPVDAENQETCKNCGTTFRGRYCPECGQSVRDFQKPFGMVAIDFLGNVAAFDTRLWHTIKPLLWQPGKLTREFLSGKRVRYVPPFRLLFFFSFVFFLLLSFHYKGVLRAHLKDTEKLQKQIEVNGLTPDSLQNMTHEQLKTHGEVLGNISKKMEEGKDSIRRESERAVFRKVSMLLKYPEVFLSKLMQTTSWMVFLLIPVFALFLRLFFRKTDRYYISHLIFTVHFHAFLYLAGIIALLGIWIAGPQTDGYITLLLFVAAAVYFFLSIRKFYQRSWWVTVKRFIMISGLYFISLMVMLLAAAYISFAFL
jgi:hypothetical protein